MTLIRVDVQGRTLRRVVAGLICGLALTSSALAATGYPTRTVRIIVPYGAGGIADVTMRLTAQKLSEKLGQQFIVDNRPGAGGMVGAQRRGIGGARRLHPVDDRRRAHHRQIPVQVAALRPGRGFRADLDHGGLRSGDRRQGGFAG